MRRQVKVGLNIAAGIAAISLALWLQAKPAEASMLCANTDCFGPNRCEYLIEVECHLWGGSCSVQGCTLPCESC
jgi:hypothetical protein